MSTSNESIGPTAVLKCPKLNGPLITYCRAVHAALLNNPSFPSPNPALAVFAADIDALDEAETKAASRGKGGAALRDAKKKKVKDGLHHLCDYVQSVVETNMSPSAGAALIESAHMSVRKMPNRHTPELSARNTDVSGKVVVVAKAVAREATYRWEYSLDQSSWTPIPELMRARTEIAGLTSARVYSFRFRAFTRKGLRDYSQVVSLLVH